MLQAETEINGVMLCRVPAGHSSHCRLEVIARRGRPVREAEDVLLNGIVFWGNQEVQRGLLVRVDCVRDISLRFCSTVRRAR